MRASTWALSALLLVVACDDAAEIELAPPDGFTFQSGDRSIALAWSNASSERIAILRWPYPSGLEPPEGAVLDVGRTFDGGGVVLYVGQGESFVDRTIDTCGSAYEYQAYTLGLGTTRSAPATRGKAVPRIADPGASPQLLEATVVDGGVELQWDEPASPTDFVDIVRGAGSLEGAISIHSERGAGSHVDRGDDLEPGATYFYAAVSCNACGSCSTEGAEAVVTIPVDFAPTELTVDPNGATVDFRWNAPQGTFVTMRLLAREGAPVEGPDDPEAERIHEGLEGEETAAKVAMTTFLPDLPGFSHHYHFAVYACGMGGSCSEGAAADRAFTLREALRGGGHVVYFRHGEAGVCVDRTDLGTAEETAVPDWWESCARSCDVATAEQLSAAGYLGAEAAGLALRNAGIPFDSVLTSEYCRAVETAQRLEIVARSDIESRPELSPFVHVSDEERCTSTRALLAGVALGSPSRNAAVVGHGGLPEACADLDALAPGEAAVFRPTEDGPLLLARILPDAWSELP